MSMMMASGRLAAAVLFAAGLAGCAALSPATPEAAVSARALGYWQAVMAGKWDDAYAFATSGYREAVDLFGYRKRHDSFVKYKNAEVVGVNCDEPGVCTVKMQLRVVIAIDSPTEVTKVIEERWLEEAGQWHRYISR